MPARRRLPEPIARRIPPKLVKELGVTAKGFLRAGQQSFFTKAIVDYARKFPGNNLESIGAMVSDIASFKRRHYTAQNIGKAYAKSSAHEIIESRSVAITKGKNLGALAAVEGCLDYNVALCTALRAKGIPAKFVRIGLHSLTHFFFNGKWFEADPTSGIARTLAERMNRRGQRVDVTKLPPLVKPIDFRRQEEINSARQRGAYAEGLDAWAIGIKSIGDFHKFEH